MATYQQAQQQVRQQAQRLRQQIEQRRKLLERQRKQQLTQEQLRKTSYEQRQKALQKIQQQKSQLEKAKEEVKTGEKKALTTLKETRERRIRAQKRRLARKRQSFREFEKERVSKLPLEQQPTTVMVDGMGYSVPVELQEKFAKEQIEKYGAKKVETQEVIYKPEQISVEPDRLPRLEEIKGVVTEYKQPTGLAGLRYKISQPRQELITKQQLGRKLSPAEYGKLAGTSLGLGAFDVGVGTVMLPYTAYKLATQPKQTIAGFKQEMERVGREARISPTATLSYVGGGLLISGGLGLGGRYVYAKTGYPKFQTRFLTKELGSQGESIFFRTAGVTTQENILFPKKTYVSGSLTQVKLGKTGDLTPYVAGTETVIVRVTKKPYKKVGEPVGVVGAEYGVIEKAPLRVLMQKTPEVRYVQEGVQFRGVGKQKVLGKKPVEYYVTAGVGAELSETTSWLFGKSVPVGVKHPFIKKVLVSGGEYSLGLIRRDIDPTTTIISTPSKLARPKTKYVSEVATKNILETTIRKQVYKSVEGKTTVISGTSEILQPSKPVESIYAGTGMYERTEEVTAPTPIIKSSQIVKPLEISAVSPSLISPQTELLQQKEVQKEIPSQITILKSGFKEKVIEKLAQLQVQRQRQKLILIQKLRQITRTKTKVIKLVYPKFYSKLSGKGKKRLIEMFDERDGIIQPQIKRFGKWLDIGDPTTFRKAKQRAVSKVRRTLGASFRLLKAGKEIPIGRFPYGFRPSKKRLTIGVERRRKRLDMPTEVSEIIKFKNPKGRLKI